MNFLKNLFRSPSHLTMLLLALLVLVVSYVYDPRYNLLLLVLAAAWLVGLLKSKTRISLEKGHAVLRHELGWVVARESLDGVTEVIFHLLPIPPGSLRMGLRNGRLRIDASRVHRIGIADFTDQVKAMGIAVDSSRIRKGAFVKKGPVKIKIKFPGSR
jgi:hypothetical protein